MKLVEQYIYAVTRHLPVEQREDIADELRSMILDTLEEKGSKSKKNIEAVLLSLGDPDTLARKYVGSKQYVIGPTLYPTYVRILKYALATGLPIAFIVHLIVATGQHPSAFIDIVFDAIGMAIAVGIQVVFWVSSTFFVLERTGVDAKDITNSSKIWHPSMLPKLPVKRQIPISEVITDIVSYGFLIVLPFIAQPVIGAYTDGGVIPFFNQEIWTVTTPIVVLIGTLGIIKALIKLFQHNWSRTLAIGNLLFAVLVSTLLVLAYTKLQIINPDFITFVQTYSEGKSLSEISNWASWSFGITLLVIIGMYLFEAIKHTILTFKPYSV